MTDTTRVIPRPVWARRERRLVGLELDPPSEAEKQDAIRVLEAGIKWPLSLYAEAEAIMREATEGRALTVAELYEELPPGALPFEDLYPPHS